MIGSDHFVNKLRGRALTYLPQASINIILWTTIELILAYGETVIVRRNAKRHDEMLITFIKKGNRSWQRIETIDQRNMSKLNIKYLLIIDLCNGKWLSGNEQKITMKSLT